MDNAALGGEDQPRPRRAQNSSHEVSARWGAPRYGAYRVGANPGEWYGTFHSIPQSKWVSIEKYVDDSWFAPYGGVIADAKGNLYGTTSGGCGTNSGTIFQLSPMGSSGWTESLLYTFDFLSGEGPYCSLVMDNDGNLYGTTFRGGDNDGGTVFQLSPAARGWNINFIYHFANFLGGNGDASEPLAGIIMDSSGNLYGTALGGGIYGGGAVFEVSPSQSGWLLCSS